MAIFKVEHIGKVHDLMSKLNYIMKPESTEWDLIFTSNVSIDSAYEEMMLVKQCHLASSNDTLQGRQYFEFVLSVNEGESNRVRDFSNCLQEVMAYIANFNGGDYQVIAAIHTNTDNLHAHIITNNIEMKTGERLLVPPERLVVFKRDINSILELYAFEGIESDSFESF